MTSQLTTKELIAAQNRRLDSLRDEFIAIRGECHKLAEQRDTWQRAAEEVGQELTWHRRQVERILDRTTSLTEPAPELDAYGNWVMR